MGKVHISRVTKHNQVAELQKVDVKFVISWSKSGDVCTTFTSVTTVTVVTNITFVLLNFDTFTSTSIKNHCYDALEANLDWL